MNICVPGWGASLQLHLFSDISEGCNGFDWLRFWIVAKILRFVLLLSADRLEQRFPVARVFSDARTGGDT